MFCYPSILLQGLHPLPGQVYQVLKVGIGSLPRFDKHFVVGPGLVQLPQVFLQLGTSQIEVRLIEDLFRAPHRAKPLKPPQGFLLLAQISQALAPQEATERSHVQWDVLIDGMTDVELSTLKKSKGLRGLAFRQSGQSLKLQREVWTQMIAGGGFDRILEYRSSLPELVDIP